MCGTGFAKEKAAAVAFAYALMSNDPIPGDMIFPHASVEVSKNKKHV